MIGCLAAYSLVQGLLASLPGSRVLHRLDERIKGWARRREERMKGSARFDEVDDRGHAVKASWLFISYVTS
jgi:hypothetical protein